MPPKKTKASTSEGDESEFSILNSKLDLLIKEVTDNNKRLKQMETAQADFKKSIEFLYEDVKEYKSKTIELEQKVKSLNASMDTIKSLEDRLEAYEYAERSRCIELNGIPYAKDESLMVGMERILQHIKLTSINITTDIDKIYRIRKTNKVIIKFMQSSKRDAFFQTYRKNILCASALGFTGNSEKIYINEVLSTVQNKLYWQTRNFKKEHNFKYVWTYRQKIFLRKTQESDAVMIGSETDLETLLSH